MNKNKMLLLLAIGMIMGGCKNENKIKTQAYPYPVSVPEYLTDTLFVAGIFDQPYAYTYNRTKNLKCFNKRGIEYNLNIDISKKNIRSIVPYIERGDTIVVENGVIVKNITMNNMVNNYLNGR